MSLLKTGDIVKYDTSLATLAAALDVSEVLDRLLEEETRIKWVNDIYHNGYKLAGILTEGTLEFETGSLSALIIGIGININTEEFPSELQDIAASLYSITGRKFVRNEIIAEIIDALEKYLLMTKNDKERLVRLYKEKMLYLGEEITVRRGTDEFSAHLTDLNEEGHLILKRNHETLTLNSGEISIRKRDK
jgi:BirA family biotin operon repressor/biotin-[acetyl-CoA-carboxylase] ligase